MSWIFTLLLVVQIITSLTIISLVLLQQGSRHGFGLWQRFGRQPFWRDGCGKLSLARHEVGRGGFLYYNDWPCLCVQPRRQGPGYRRDVQLHAIGTGGAATRGQCGSCSAGQRAVCRGCHRARRGNRGRFGSRSSCGPVRARSPCGTRIQVRNPAARVKQILRPRDTIFGLVRSLGFAAIQTRCKPCGLALSQSKSGILPTW